MPVVVIAIIVVYTYFMSPSNEPAEYEKVASCITNDDRLGPMVYDSQVYIPITIELDYAGTAVRLAILYTRIRTIAAGTMRLQHQTSYI